MKIKIDKKSLFRLTGFELSNMFENSEKINNKYKNTHFFGNKSELAN